MTKIYILAKIIIEGYYSRYYTPMIDTGAGVNVCRHNCLPEDKWEKLLTPIVVTGCLFRLLRRINELNQQDNAKTSQVMPLSIT